METWKELYVLFVWLVLVLAFLVVIPLYIRCRITATRGIVTEAKTESATPLKDTDEQYIDKNDSPHIL